MNDVQRNFVTAGIVCAASAALIGGMAMREKVDERSAGLLSSTSIAPGLMASREPIAEIPEERYFYDLMVLLKREYVDPIPSELPLAVGSVKGMISSLDDEASLYMSKTLFPAFVRGIEGQYEGIGANLVMRRASQNARRPYRSLLDVLERVPVVRVAYVVPGGPAYKAGIRPGDEIDSIDGRWVVNPEIVLRLRKIEAQIAKKELPASAKTEIQSELRTKFKNSMMPMRAFERLSTGSTGEVKLAWRRNGKLMQGSLSKAQSSATVNTVDANGVFRPAFTEGAAEKLKSAVESRKLRAIDLRGIEQGDLKEMRECLAILGPSGEYGRVLDDAGKSESVKVAKGASQSKVVRLMVDGYTSGIAEAFALALKSKKLATLEGGSMAGNPTLVERTSLPDGSGFTLRIGKFQAGGKA